MNEKQQQQLKTSAFSLTPLLLTNINLINIEIGNNKPWVEKEKSEQVVEKENELFKPHDELVRVCLTFNEIFKVFSSLKKWHSGCIKWTHRNGVKLNRIKNNKHHFNVDLLTFLRPRYEQAECLVLHFPWTASSTFSQGFNFTSTSGSNLIFIDGVTSEQIIGCAKCVQGSSIASNICSLLIFHQLQAKGNWIFPEEGNSVMFGDIITLISRLAVNWIPRSRFLSLLILPSRWNFFHLLGKFSDEENFSLKIH